MFILVAVGLFAVALVGMTVAMWRAPEGYEDETGFHLGKRKKDPDKKKV